MASFAVSHNSVTISTSSSNKKANNMSQILNLKTDSCYDIQFNFPLQ